jgi:hypothetical protein
VDNLNLFSSSYFDVWIHFLNQYCFDIDILHIQNPLGININIGKTGFTTSDGKTFFEIIMLKDQSFANVQQTVFKIKRFQLLTALSTM